MSLIFVTLLILFKAFCLALPIASNSVSSYRALFLAGFRLLTESWPSVLAWSKSAWDVNPLTSTVYSLEVVPSLVSSELTFIVTVAVVPSVVVVDLTALINSNDNPSNFLVIQSH